MASKVDLGGVPYRDLIRRLEALEAKLGRNPNLRGWKATAVTIGHAILARKRRSETRLAEFRDRTDGLIARIQEEGASIAAGADHGQASHLESEVSTLIDDYIGDLVEEGLLEPTNGSEICRPLWEAFYEVYPTAETVTEGLEIAHTTDWWKTEGGTK